MSEVNLLSKIKNELSSSGVGGVVLKSYKWLVTRLKNLIADIILSTPYSKIMLSKWFTPQNRNWFDHLLFNTVLNRWFNKKYWNEPCPDVRVRLQSLLMGGQSGVNWAQTYGATEFDPKTTAKVGELTFQQACPGFLWLNSLLEKLENADIYQIGSGSGREVAYYAKLFPQHKFWGTDLFEEVVDRSSKLYQSINNLNFAVCAAKELPIFIDNNTTAKVAILFSSGSLQYVQPEHLTQLFSQLACVAKKKGTILHAIILEPANEIPKNPYILEKSMPRGNFSWTHNYLGIVKKSSFVIENSEIIRPYVPYSKYYPNHQGTVQCAIHAWVK
jgi:SAM-dependent methyltransferase